ncbi:hypothetical protein HK103_002262 [Boothiomyces macroporosus]|uniref:Arrestin C-terminal-like domain-containing protein n=1 Tax=Boothiomyces macroporosus TaxID=261099 RepID=A0AAD5UDB4_9FUNG|nr:hypothetical protein HK103_002262 [Boothiomyces macroporosus]
MDTQNNTCTIIDKSRSTSPFSDYSQTSSLPRLPPLLHNDPIQPTSNVKFNPIPSTSGKCSKLKINVVFDSSLHVAGGSINGRLEVVSSTSKYLLLGEISVQLNGIEEILRPSFKQSQSFLKSKIMYQGDRCPPSQAVSGPIREGGYYSAIKGKTIFEFSFELPKDVPASFEVANFRLVSFKYGDQTDTAFITKHATVVDQWDLALEKSLDTSVTAVNSKPVFMGGPGVVHLEGCLLNSFVSSGNTISIEIKVTNNTKRKVSGVKVSFMKKLLMICPAIESGKENDEIKVKYLNVKTLNFNDKNYYFEPNETDFYTIRKTSLSELVCRVVVGLSMPGLFAKDLNIEFPLKVCHPASLNPPKAPVLPPLCGIDEYEEFNFNASDNFRSLDRNAARRLPWEETDMRPIEPPQKRRNSEPAPSVVKPQPRKIVMQPNEYTGAEDRYRNLAEQSVILDECLSPSQKMWNNEINRNGFGDLLDGLDNMQIQEKPKSNIVEKSRHNITECDTVHKPSANLGYIMDKAFGLLEYAITSPEESGPVPPPRTARRVKTKPPKPDLPPKPSTISIHPPQKKVYSIDKKEKIVGKSGTLTKTGPRNGTLTKMGNKSVTLTKTVNKTGTLQKPKRKTRRPKPLPKPYLISKLFSNVDEEEKTFTIRKDKVDLSFEINPLVF